MPKVDLTEEKEQTMSFLAKDNYLSMEMNMLVYSVSHGFEDDRACMVLIKSLI